MSQQRKKFQGQWCADLNKFPFTVRLSLALRLGFENETEVDIDDHLVENLVDNETEVDDQNLDKSVEKPLCQYELIRLENIREREQMWAKLQIEQAKSALNISE